MIFSSPIYMLFFGVVLLTVHRLNSKHHQKLFLLFASYFFYAYWDWRFVFLLLLISLVNYCLGEKIWTSNTAARIKYLRIGIVFDLSVLGLFKYLNFFIDSFNVLLIQLGLRLPHIDILLPVAVSFIIFEVISYMVDIYRGNGRPADSFESFALLVAFFPHLIAGPILKPAHFLAQLTRPICITWNNIEIGIQIFMLGLVKKVLIADRLALFVDPIFKNPAFYSSETVWLAVIAYTLQIYCDFSGYTDMAIGSARCMGLMIPENFNMPYLSRNIAEFWRRWHISLSTWLRDYLYIPLGGNRKGRRRTYYHLLMVMLLGGLWHGASWNFVTWGGIHGIGLAIHRFYRNHLPEKIVAGRLGNVISWAITFLFVCIAWIFFRCSDFSIAWTILGKMFGFLPAEGVRWYATSLWLIIPMVVLGHLICCKAKQRYFSLTTFRGLFVFFFVLFGVLFFMPIESSPFIYFQF